MLKSILLTVALVAVVIAVPNAQPIRNVSAATTAPDLVVLSALAVGPAGGYVGHVKVKVKNQGDAPSEQCDMTVRIITQKGDLQGGITKIYRPKVQALSPGQEIEVKADTNLMADVLKKADYVITIDRSNTVEESDEENNILKGTFTP